MITLKDGSKFKDAHIDWDFVVLSGSGDTEYLSAKEYSEKWSKGVINPLPERDATDWKNGGDFA